MNRFPSPVLLALAALSVLLAPRAFAQNLDDLNIQFHGYATQAFLYTSQLGVSF